MKRFLLACSLLLLTAAATGPNSGIATFAGGCFWCMQGPFEKLPGVLSVTVGYTGGHVKSPSYEEVSSGATGHRESVQIIYDRSRINYAQLLDVFWQNIDPTDNEGQFCDKGPQYRSAIFYHDENQKQLAESTKAAFEKRFPHVYTDVLPASEFWRAEEYHQHYAQKNPVRYKFYRFNCGRDQRLAEVWGHAPAE